MGRGARNITHVVTLGQGWGIFAAAAIADLVAVLIFVLVGRASHHEALSWAGLATTAWPFVIGVVGGYIGVVMTRLSTVSLRGGAVVVVKTLILGLALRYGVQRDGTPLPFIVVTVVVLSALMLGWRLVAKVPQQRANTRAREALKAQS
jgi:hypothetical protein